MPELSEPELVDGLRSGQVEAWHALYDAYAERVWRLAARLLGGSTADVADVVQETFMAAARSARKFDPARGSVWLWLCGIARNYVALHYRKEARQERLKAAAERLALSNGRAQAWLQGGEPLPAEVLETAELATLVRCALAELSPEYETLLTARYLDDISVDNLRKRSKRR